LGLGRMTNEENDMARQSSWVWILVACVLFWIVAAINAWRVVAQGPVALNVIPAVAFAVGGTLLLWAAFRARDRGSQ